MDYLLIIVFGVFLFIIIVRNLFSPAKCEKCSKELTMIELEDPECSFLCENCKKKISN